MQNEDGEVRGASFALAFDGGCKSVMIVLAMLLGFLRKDGDAGQSVPVFLPSHLTCYVGKDAYAAILGEPVVGLDPNKRDEPLKEIVEAEGLDMMKAIGEALKRPGTIICVKFNAIDEASVARIAASFPDESIYILSPTLPPLTGRPVSEITSFGKTGLECFDDFVGDVTGYRPAKKKATGKKGYSSHLNERPIHPIDEPIPVPESPAKPVQIQNEKAQKAVQNQPVFDWDTYQPYPFRESFSRHARRDLPNIGFALVFALLTFATSIGYFFLAPNSSAFFRVICIIMAVVFPILSCIPIGFIYDDNGRKVRPMSITMAFALCVLVGAVLLCSFILVAVGNCNGWDSGELLLHFCLNLAPILWATVRILIDPLLLRFKK